MSWLAVEPIRDRADVDDGDDAESALRLAYWRERFARDGRDVDAVGLARLLMVAPGDGPHLAEALTVLDTARRATPTSQPVLEHLALLYARLGRSAELDEVLAVLVRIYPDSAAVRVAATTDTANWEQVTAEVQATFFDDITSDDPAVVAAAVESMQRWARSYPTNSTYTVNLAFGLLALGDKEGVLAQVRAAIAIEDGSFADAYNIGVLLRSCGDRTGGTTWLGTALDRATSPEERALAAEATGP